MNYYISGLLLFFLIMGSYAQEADPLDDTQISQMATVIAHNRMAHNPSDNLGLQFLKFSIITDTQNEVSPKLYSLFMSKKAFPNQLPNNISGRTYSLQTSRATLGSLLMHRLEAAFKTELGSSQKQRFLLYGKIMVLCGTKVSDTMQTKITGLGTAKLETLLVLRDVDAESTSTPKVTPKITPKKKP
jgi:hypothetical protein